MNTELPRPVMDDLAVLYVSGEASAETRALVERYASRFPDYGAGLRGGQGSDPVPDVLPAINVNTEMEALKRTKEHLFLRTLFFAMGMAFTLPLGLFTVREGQLSWLLYRDVPGVFWAFSGVAAASWTAWVLMRRELAKTGL